MARPRAKADPNPYGYDLAAVWPPGSSELARSYQRHVEKLVASEQWDPEQRRSWQFGRLRRQLRFLQRYSPAYRERLDEAGIGPDRIAGLSDTDGLRQLPVLDRADLEDQRMFATHTPDAHGGVARVQSSGSTQAPLFLNRTALAARMFSLQRILELLRYRADFSSRYATTRWDADDDPMEREPELRGHWPYDGELGCTTGPAMRLPFAVPIEDQLAHLREFRPTVYRAGPGILIGLTRLLEERREQLPSVRLLRTLGEQLTTPERERIEASWGTPLSDMYGASETGAIAALCPEGRLYHAVEENLILEVLDEEGRLCAEGEVGEVVATCITNWATPVIRYRVGDHAQVGPASCSCGRTATTLSAIVGRTKHTLRRLAGDEVLFRRIVLTEAPIQALSTECQVIQTAPGTLELRYVSSAPRSPEVERAAAEHLSRMFGYEGKVRCLHVEALERTLRGKIIPFVRRRFD